jgi:hypothetical protein
MPVVGVGWKEGGDAGVLRDVVKLSIGGGDSTASRSCAIVKPACGSGGSVVCWGYNLGGEIGTGQASAYLPPSRVLAP